MHLKIGLINAPSYIIIVNNICAKLTYNQIARQEVFTIQGYDVRVRVNAFELYRNGKSVFDILYQRSYMSEVIHSAEV